MILTRYQLNKIIKSILHEGIAWDTDEFNYESDDGYFPFERLIQASENENENNEENNQTTNHNQSNNKTNKTVNYSQTVIKGVSQNTIDRCIALGLETEIDPAFIYAIESKESGHKPNVMAWNLHIATNNNYSKRANASPLSEENIRKMKEATINIPHQKTSSNGASFYGQNALSSFEAAFAIDSWHAFAGGAWGLYQVLGAYMLPSFDNDALKALNFFKSNPIEFSINSFKTWINLPEKQRFKNLVKANDYDEITKLYYGHYDSDYSNYIRSKVNEWRAGLINIKKENKSTNESWKNRLGTEKARGINFHRLADNKNNYRAGINQSTNPTVDFWKELKTEYGIQNVIALNGDNIGKQAADNAERAGLKVFRNFINENDMGSRSNFDKIQNILNSGNTLIYCSYGADRTGAYVGRYYIESLRWDINRAIDDALAYGGPKTPATNNFLQVGPSY